MATNNLDAKRNTARYFVEHRQVSWVLLLGVLAWGVYGYLNMPQRKDPEIPVRDTLAVVVWPGMPAERVEQLVTKKVEERLGQNPNVTEIRSITRQGAAYIFVKFDEKLDATGRELDDLQQKLEALSLPEGVPPVRLVKDFGDTATLLLTVASPPVAGVDMDLRAREMSAALRPGRVLVAWPHARSYRAEGLRPVLNRFAEWMAAEGLVRAAAPAAGASFIGFDADPLAGVDAIERAVARLARERLQAPELHPDVWKPVVAASPAAVRAALSRAEGLRYTHRELDDFTERIEKALKALPQVSRVSRSGVLPEQVQLHYSQERWGAYGISVERLRQLMASRSVVANPGSVDAQGRTMAVATDADFRGEREIGDVLLPSPGGASAYLRDLVQVERGYETPARFLNFFRYRDEQGRWQRARAISIDVQMRAGGKIAEFDKAVSAELERVRRQLPADLIVDRTSDQPRQVDESVSLFMSSLWEAIALVVLVSWIGFWEWRSSLIMALAIPITLAMTFGMVSLLGIDLQQVSIASLIIALGLLVDDPVVAGDAIKRELAAGRPRLLAAWQGPTKLARAILFATITNIVAYLPFLLLTGDNRRFLYSLPIVMTCSLVASRLVSMTFIPLLGYLLLREKREPSLAERRTRGFGAFYARFGHWAIANRWKVAAGFTVFLAVVSWAASGLKEQFFPFERQHLSYAEVWLPENASISATDETVRKVESVLLRVAREYGGEREVLRSATTWVGGGGPRYWISSNPEPEQVNYAHVLLQVHDSKDTEALIPLWQRALNAEIAGATVDVRRLETSAPVGIPVQIRLTGSDLGELRAQARKLQDVLRSTPGAARVRDDWREDVLTADVRIDEARAALSGVSRREIAAAAVGGLDGLPVGSI
ncbi:MAG TPA: AcrB/AcrD/AcrF family protein, partial [Solibacterales bacterium]|nr:AcrB/AcrD/AcrF family protein [Bryobacterales bacterium]